MVAQTKDGELWAIQAKADHPDRAIPKRELDSFLSESNRPDFAYRLVIATTDDIGRNARHTIEGQEKPVGLVLRGQLLSTQIRWPTRLGATFRPLPKKKPYPHQAKAVRDVLEGFCRHDRGQLIMACGTGKTLAALWVLQELRSRRTLLLVPSLSLITQTLSEWEQNSREPFDYLVVCSDETVTHRGEDHAVMSTHDLGVPVTTDPATIRRFIAKHSRDQAAVIFCTYQSSDRIALAQQGRTPRFDLVLADEAHRCAGHADSLFGTVLDSAKIKAKKRLFMTATPRYFTARVKRKAEELEYELASMDDEAAFGPVFHEFTFDAAIRADQLTDYQVAVIGVTGAEIRRWVEEARLVRTREGTQTDARTLATQIGVAKAMRRYDLRKVISFHTSVAKANRFTDDTSPESLPAVIGQMSASSRPSGQLWTRHISGHTPAARRATLLRAFGVLPKKTRGVISNCACLGEGVDVPVLDGVAFVDPKRSMIDIIQAVGRVIRKAEDKKVGTVVIPVFIDESADAEAALSSSAFAPVWQVLRALRAHDTVLADQLDEIRLRLGKRLSGTAKVRLPARIKFDMPILLFKDFAQAVFVRTVKMTTGIPALTKEQILAWADEHNRVTGNYPTVWSGGVLGASDENWTAIDACLKHGFRGLPGGSSLRELLMNYRGVRRRYDAPPLSEDQIWSWMKSHRERTGDWPNDKSGLVEDAPGETWAGIDLALARGTRGTQGGSSLAKLRGKHTDILTVRQAAATKRSQILEYITVHKKLPPSSDRLGAACSGFRSRDAEFRRLTDRLLKEVGGSTQPQRSRKTKKNILAFIRRNKRPPESSTPLGRAFGGYRRTDQGFRAETDRLLEEAGCAVKRYAARPPVKRDEILRFIERERRLPGPRREGEEQLGSACLRYRSRDKAFRAQTDAVLKKHGVKTKREAAQDKRKLVLDFVRTHGRLPSQTKPSEKRLGGLCSHYRQRDKKFREEMDQILQTSEKAYQTIIRRIQQLRRSGMTFRAIAEALNKAGFKTRWGKKWSTERVRASWHEVQVES